MRQLSFLINFALFGWPQPRCSCGKSGVGRVIPLHWRPDFVPSLGQNLGKSFFFGLASFQKCLLSILGFNIDIIGHQLLMRIGHADFLAHVDVWRPAT